MTDPFAPVDAPPPPPPTGDIDVARAVADGLAAIPRNLLPLGALLLLLPAFYLSCCTCVGWVPFVPIALWVSFRVALGAVDGRAGAVGLVDGVEKIFLRGWGIVLVYFVLMLPVYAISMPVSMEAALREAQVHPALQAGMVVASLLWSLVICRFTFAPWLVIERGVPVIEAFGLAWRSTHGPWLKLVGLQLVCVLLNAPGSVLSVGAGFLVEPVRPGQPPDLAPVLLVLVALGVSVVTSGLGLLFYAAAYRQLFGPAPAVEAGS